ncbi:serine/threonine-protein kinase [Brevibacterium sp. FME17]|uniref:serine/threonine-protein kinase n=1 Tax=Brevibacterium sp. FME17 TaxID=2742606 RepID=UPI001865FF12|nr:serine/threonine-protein kinase [Brevibacterium sp. FME17]
MGQDLGGYRLIEELGAGGMGVVYLGVDGGNNPVAVKVLHPHIANDETARKRLGREVRTLRRIKHPRIAEVLDAELESAQPFIITEFVDGQTLSDDVRENGPFAEDELVHFGHALLDALNAVHESGVIHRDLKPANVMIMDGEPMVIDFGIAQVADEVRVTATGLVMGTPGYLSPEIADGKTSSEKTDWWGWAATMAYAATGRNPYGSGPLEAVLGRVAMGKFDLENAPRNFVPLIAACLDPKPERRPSGQMILDALVDIESGRAPQLGSGPAAGSWNQASPTGTARMPAVDGNGSGYGGPAALGAAAGGAAAYEGAGGYGGAGGYDVSGYGATGHGSPRGGAPGSALNPNASTPGAAGPGGTNPQAYPRQGFSPHGQMPGRQGSPAVTNRGTAPPVRNPNGSIQSGPGSAMAGTNLGGSGYGVAGPPAGRGGSLAGPGTARPDHNGTGVPQGQPGQLRQPGQQGQPGQPDYGWGPMTYRTIRTGGWVVFALILLAITIMPLGPLLVTFFVFLWSILARTGTRLDRKAQKHRFERGTNGRGFLRSLASAPGAILASVLTSITTLILPAIAGVAMLVLTRLDIAEIVPSGYSEQWSVWAAGAAGGLVLWLGPGAGSLRHGSRLMVSGVTRNRLGRLIALSAIALLIIVAIMVIQSDAGMTWWPLSTNPFTYLPGPV